MSYTLPFVATDIKKVIDSQYHPPHHDCSDDAYTTGSRQSVNASTEYDFEVNCAFENSVFPDHITKLWDPVTNMCDFSEEMNTPKYVARLQLTFEPTTANAGIMEFRAYINDATPKLIQTIRVPFKATESRMEALFAFYVGSETGYDMKNDGLYFTYECSLAGEVWDRGILVYRT